jgi:hypothetical protein
MKATASNKEYPIRESIDISDIRIGKDVIEIVTSGMYVSPVTVYREFVQTPLTLSMLPGRPAFCCLDNSALSRSPLITLVGL